MQDNWLDGLRKVFLSPGDAAEVTVVAGLEKPPRNVPAVHSHRSWELKFHDGGNGGVSRWSLVPPEALHVSDVPDVSILLDSRSFYLGCGGGSGVLREENSTVCRLLLHICRALQAAAGAGDPEIPEHLAAAFRAALAAAFRLFAENSAGNSRPDWYLLVTELVARKYYDPNLSVEGISRRMGVTSQYLNRVFRRSCAMSMREYIVEYRLNRARELLKSGTCRVGEAAALTGWRSPFYFSRSYRKRFGSAPGCVIGRAARGK